ncbi:MAG: YcbK family protein [Desulfobacteraceae bacterium]|nr:YcbK family protein [Desulfobacteraceae bacterium]
MSDCKRRDFLKAGLGFLAGSLLPVKALAAMISPLEVRRTLALYNIHTEEHLDVCYFDQDGYRFDALTQIDHFLRDYRTGEVNTIDVDLIDLLYTVQCHIRPSAPFSIISGYRSRETNERLRRSTAGVAKDSFHTKGKAIDIRLPGYNTTSLRDLCVDLQAGGVGYYRKSNFVHIDIGPVRTW